MKWHEFVFSDERHGRNRRHIIFWTVWLIYFSFTFFYRQQPLLNQGWAWWAIFVLLKSVFILLGHVFICYITIYFFLPRFLLRGRYLSFGAGLVAAGSLVTAWTYFCYWGIFPILDAVVKSPAGTAANALLWNS